MIRKNLIEWQWADYPSKHQNRANLVLHLVVVPMFWAGTFLLVRGVILGLAFIAISLILQGHGHRLEKEAPIPFLGAGDFVSRILVEQFINFPRFILTGGWLRSFK